MNDPLFAICHSTSSEADLAGLVRVFREARQERLRFLLDLHDANEDREFFSNTLLRQNEVWVADVDERIVGFIAFAEGWVNQLYVACEFQRRGIGSALLEIPKQTSPSLQLWVFEINLPAIRFYERHGFLIVERTNGASNEARRPDLRMRWENGIGQPDSGELDQEQKP
jgi:putative acetyltransferase